MRVALHFAKLGPVRFVSHLDFQALWQKAFVMAGYRLSLTQGYNPRPRMRFALPLATGYQSRGELLEIYFEEGVCLHELKERLNQALPRGVEVLGCTELPEQYPKLTKLVDGLEYRVEIPEAVIVEPGSVAHGFGDEVLRCEIVSGGLELLLPVKEQRSVRPERIAGAIWPGVDYWNVTRSAICTRLSPGQLSPWPAGLKKVL